MDTSEITKVKITLPMTMSTTLTFTIPKEEREAMTDAEFHNVCHEAAIGWQRDFDRRGGHDAGGACLYGTVDDYDPSHAGEEDIAV